MVCSFTWLLAGLLFVSSTSATSLERVQLSKRAARENIVTTCRKSGQFALTIDDGVYDWHNVISDELSNNRAKGTFFVNGENWACIYDNAEKLQGSYKQGHLIASHTWSHADITSLSPQALRKEITKLEVALKKILGVKPAFFRPPYGAYDDTSLAVVRDMGYTPILWSFDSKDSIGDSAAQSKAMYKKAARSYPKSQIALNHETYSSTAYEVIPYAIQELKANGYKLVTVAECLGQAPYQTIYTHKMPKRDASWHC